jgi:CBS-domain-containing membrane protein
LDAPLAADGNAAPKVVGPGDTLRSVANLMASSKLTRYPVIDGAGKFAGIITIEDLLAGRSRERLRENDRSRVLRMRWPFSSAGVPAAMTAQAEVATEEVAALDGDFRG